MFGPVTPEKAIVFTRLSVALNCCWPLPSTATRGQLLRFNIMRFLVIVSAFALVLPLLYAMHVHRDDPVIFTNAGCLAVAVCQVPVHALLCMAHYDRIQALVEQMTDCCAQAKSYERRVLVRYIDKYSTFYGLCVAWFYVTAAVFDVGTLFISQPFPSNAEYPFSVDYEPMRTFVYLHQVVVSFQCSAAVCMNVFVALLLFFAGARFEMLMAELRDVRDIESLKGCVKKYYFVRSYAQEVVSVVQYSAVYTTIMATLPLVLSGLSIIGRQAFTVKLQFLSLGGLALLEVFLCAWPADNLLDVSENTVRSLYESSWYDRTVRMQKFVLLSLVPQEPITISFACVVPVLSLMFYCSYVSNAFSLFTALRLMMYTEDES